MPSDPALEKTLDKVLNRNENEIMSNLKESLDSAQKTLSDSLPKLEQEYDRIISEGKKEAEKLQKQIVGSSDLEARNKQLVLVEQSAEKVFETAIEKIKNSPRDDSYSQLISSLLSEATNALGTSEITVFTNSTDQQVVQNAVSAVSGAELSPETIECMGGIKVKSKDGTMTFDNTLDAKLDRLKPLIRKEISSKFSIGN